MTETRDWNTCPMMERYKTTKRNYLKEIRKERWTEGQRFELWNAIDLTFSEIQEPRKEYWIRRLYTFYNHRFTGMTKCRWLTFLGELSDSAAYGSYRDEKARRYCCLVRDMAYFLTHRTARGEIVEYMALMQKTGA